MPACCFTIPALEIFLSLSVVNCHHLCVRPGSHYDYSVRLSDNSAFFFACSSRVELLCPTYRDRHTDTRHTETYKQSIRILYRYCKFVYRACAVLKFVILILVIGPGLA